MLTAVKPECINEFWNDIKCHIDRTAEKTNSRWKREDVYFDLITDHATLYIAEDDSGLIGFVILNRASQYGDIILNIWLAVNIMSGQEDTLFATDEIKQIAYDIGAKYITFVSTRKGFSKLNEKTGFKEEFTNYIYEV